MVSVLKRECYVVRVTCSENGETSFCDEISENGEKLLYGDV